MANVDLSLSSLENLAKDVEAALTGVNSLLKAASALPFLGKYATELDELETVLTFVAGVLAKV